jgi:hypothetical protein
MKEKGKYHNIDKSQLIDHIRVEFGKKSMQYNVLIGYIFKESEIKI